MVKVGFEKMELEQQDTFTKKRKSRLDRELSGTELFGGAISKD